MSIDTDAMKWCTHPCSRTDRIAEATSSKLTLWAASQQAGYARSFSIDRVSGSYLLLSITPESTLSAIGECVAAPFTGLEPRARF